MQAGDGKQLYYKSWPKPRHCLLHASEGTLREGDYTDCLPTLRIQQNCHAKYNQMPEFSCYLCACCWQALSESGNCMEMNTLYNKIN